jgi:D-lactate dehydrogenase (cytochrome)
MKNTYSNAFADELQILFGDRATRDETVRNDHGTGFSYHACTPPDYVVYPHSTEEVSALVHLCGRFGVPLVPFGAGTSVEGHILAVRGGVCVDMRRMNQIREIREADLCATVQAGVTRNQLDDRLDGSGFFFPIGPGVNATLGGMAANRASGTNAVRYGTMRENVLALTVVLPNGQIIRTGSKAKKSSTGYDLTRLFVGAEGTLGIITELTIRLYPVPETTRTAIGAFPSIDAAVNTAIHTIQQGVPIAKIELLDAHIMRAINRLEGTTYPEKTTLFLEFNGTARQVEEQIGTVETIARSLGAEEFVWETDAASRRKLWAIRTNAAPAAQGLVPGSGVMSTDVCVPISRLAECLRDTEADIAASDLLAPVLGHVGDGNFHLAILIPPNDPEALQGARALNERLVRRALRMEGTASGEHGIGVGKQPYMALEHGDALDVMRVIKAALDPAGIMNPGKLLP